MNTDFITSKVKLIENCPECNKQKLVKIWSKTIDWTLNEDGTINDTVWTFANLDIGCTNCDYSQILASDNYGSNSVTKMREQKYLNTNTSKTILEAVGKREVKTISSSKRSIMDILFG